MAEHTEDLIELLYQTIEQKNEQIQKLQEMVRELNVTVANLNETIEEFRRKFFGTSSEKARRRETGEEATQEPETEGSPVRSHTRRKPKARREELYEKLPVREIRCPIPEGERLCPDCDAEMETIAWQFVREELRITPAKVERMHARSAVRRIPARSSRRRYPPPCWHTVRLRRLWLPSSCIRSS